MRFFMCFALLSLAVLAFTARADDFSECICWDGDSWCGGDSFWRSSCSRWLTVALLWSIPVFALMFGFLLFPLVLCSARLCCNCLGGREPSHGVCCPDKPRFEELPTGERIEQVRIYSRRSVCLTKTLFIVCFATWIYFSVGVYTTNDDVHWALLHTINHFDDAAHDINDTLSVATNGLAAVSASGRVAVPSSLVQQLQADVAQYASVLKDIDNVVSKITTAETQEQYGRNEDAYRVPSVPMVLFIVVFVLMLCNVRGAALTIIAGLFSLWAVLVVATFGLHEILAQASTETCDHYNSSIVPTVIGIATYYRGCGAPDVVAALEGLGQSYATAACDSANGNLQQLCGSYFECPPLVWSNICSAPASYSATAIAQTINATLYNATALPSSGCVPGTNITSAATGACGMGSGIQISAAQFLNFSTAVGPQMTFVLETALPDYANCTYIANTLWSSNIYSTLCHTFSTKFTNISLLFLALSIISIFMTVAILLAAKRFQKPQRDTEYATAPDRDTGRGPSVQGGRSLVYGVLVTTTEERDTYGTPLLGGGALPPAVAASPVGYAPLPPLPSGVIVSQGYGGAIAYAVPPPPGYYAATPATTPMTSGTLPPYPSAEK